VRVWIQEPGSASFVLAHGPADLAAKTGVLRVEGTPSTPDESSKWSVALGLFVCRGGEIRRLS
jgi:hypothetical protein